MSQYYFVSTYAGNGSQGYVDGITFNARFFRPSSICFDGSGNMYIADWGNHAIRKITPAGIVSTFAGNGSAGFTNGTGTGASFNKPSWIVFDSTSGNFFVIDVGNECVRKITSTGIVTTYAGSGTPGYLDGNASTAQFSQLAGLVLDASGNIYVCDRLNHCIRKISTSGIVSTVAGNGVAGYNDGSALSAQFNSLADIDIDSQGLIYIADRDNNRIRIFNPTTNMVSTFAGNGTALSTDGTLSGCSFNAPRGIDITDNDDIYVADQNGNKIRMITGNTVTTIAGSGSTGNQDGPSQYATFNLPWDVAYFQGTIYVAGDYDNSIRKIHKKFSPNSIDEEEQNVFSIFPNPTSDKINIQFNQLESLNAVEVDVYSLTGQLVYTTYLGELVAGQIISIDLHDKIISKGEYIVVVRSNNDIISSEPIIFE